MDEWINKLINEMDGWMIQWIDDWMNECVYEWMKKGKAKR